MYSTCDMDGTPGMYAYIQVGKDQREGGDAGFKEVEDSITVIGRERIRDDQRIEFDGDHVRGRRVDRQMNRAVVEHAAIHEAVPHIAAAAGAASAFEAAH